MHYAITSTLILALLSASASAVPFSTFVIPSFLPEKVGNRTVSLSASAIYYTTRVPGPSGTNTFKVTEVVPAKVPVTELSGITFPTGVPTGWSTGTGKNESTSFRKPTTKKEPSSVKATSTRKESTTASHVARALIPSELSKISSIEGSITKILPTLTLPTVFPTTFNGTHTSTKKISTVTTKKESTTTKKESTTTGKESTTTKKESSTFSSWKTESTKESSSTRFSSWKPESSTLKESTTTKESSASSSATHVPRSLEELSFSKVVDGKTVVLSIPVLALPTGTEHHHWKPTGTGHHSLPTGTGLHHPTESKKSKPTHESKQPKTTSEATFTTALE